jgi:hypothetical protein
MDQIRKVFALNRAGLNVPRALAALVVLLVPLVFLGALDQETYYLAVAFGALWVGFSDPGGEYRDRFTDMALVGIIGALLTALGFWLGGLAWGWAALGTLVVTLLCGLALKFGAHRFASGILLNAWFLVALAIPAAFEADGTKTSAWSQALAWLIGSAVWIAVTWVWWLIHGKRTQPTHMPEFPEDRDRRTLTRPIVLFAVIRAVALALSVAIAFGSGQPNADWMPIATIIAMKPTLGQSMLAAEQRIVGAVLGALIAGAFLLTLDNKVALGLVLVVLGVTGAAIYAVNYTLYTAAIAGAVLIALDLPDASGFQVESRRILFTLAGVAIGVGVMLLANVISRRTPKTSPPSAQATSAPPSTPEALT